MKRRMICACCVLSLLFAGLCIPAGAEQQSGQTQLLTLTAKDGVALTGKLDMPEEGEIGRLVIYVNGSGPNTYDNQRMYEGETFRYYDVFAEELVKRGAAFFRASTRGVTPGEEPPLYADIDEAAYRTYLPENSVSDIGEWMAKLRENPRLKDAEIVLLGWSEGTIIAPLAAKAYPKEVAGLVLAGYCNDRMDEIFDWQQSGEPSMIFYGQCFDNDGDGRISREEYDADPYDVVASVLGGAPFERIDANGDGLITAEDFALMLEPFKQAFYDAVERGDDQWLAENYTVRLTSGWFKAHSLLAPNRETLPELDLPIHIFHGTQDANCSVQGVYDIAERFAQLGKTNLTTHVYEGYDHDLLYSVYLIGGELPLAFEDLFDVLTQ